MPKRTYKKKRAGSRYTKRRTGLSRRNVGGANILLRAEKKYLDGCQADSRTAQALPVNVPFTGEILPKLVPALCDPAQGSGASERDGRAIGITNIRIKGIIRMGTANATASIENTFCRVMLVIDHQCNGTAPTVAQVLNTTGMSGTMGTLHPKQWAAFQNLDNQHRFRVLSDKTYSYRTPNQFDTNTNSLCVIPFKISKSFRSPMVVNYIGAGASTAITNIADNNLFILAVSGGMEQATTTIEVPVDIAFKSRVRYLDH